MTALDDELIRQDCDAYVIYDSSENSDMQYLSGFHASDPYIFVQKQSGERYIIVSSMEELRARREAKCNVLTRTSAGFVEFYEEYKNADLYSLSLGQKQRIMIARAVINRPQVLQTRYHPLQK